MSRRLLVVIAAVLTFAVACGGDGGDAVTDETSDSSATGTEIVIDFENGSPARDVWRQDVSIGDSVSVIVSGDRDEQVHVHGYDLYVEPDQDLLEFDALIPGRFEIELEQSGRLLLEITVS